MHKEAVVLLATLASLLAHNAPFNKIFREVKLALAREQAADSFICTLLVSRRFYPEVRSYAPAAPTGPWLQCTRANAKCSLLKHLIGATSGNKMLVY